MRQGLGAGALAAIGVALVAFAATASPLMTRHAPSDFAATRHAPSDFAATASPLMTRHAPSDSVVAPSLLHRVVIYAKEGSKKLIDGRWNLDQSEAKLGITLSPDETKQLMACTGKIVCQQPWGEVFASASSVLRPDLLVTAKHVFAKRKAVGSFGRCSFRSFLHRNIDIPVVVETDQRKGYFLNNEDFIVLRLKRELKDCTPFTIPESDTSLPEGEEIFSATGFQRRSLNRLSEREPVLARGKIRGIFNAYLGGVPFYTADVDLDEGGSGGAIFALKDGRPVSDDAGRLVMRGILVAYGPKARSGQPYSEERNYTIINGLQAQFRDLVEGKAQEPALVVPATCLQDSVAKIDVISDSVALAQSDPTAPPQSACNRDADRKDGKPSDSCIAEELEKLVKGIETLAVSRRDKGPGKEKREFHLRNDTNCPICFTYNRCNGYGCWDEVAVANAKSAFFAGVSEQTPAIRNPQFCHFAVERGPAYAGPELPLRKPALYHFDPSLPPLPSRRPDLVSANAAKPDTLFLAVKKKADRVGVHRLTSNDIGGLSLEQIRELRGY